ncbi:MAG: adenylate/guanylate cyclase domain-containing protein [Deltaproteobacteria bacterium]|nr:adenylate/guanylate cyclase domain-containing protein [Deltaproteobacteria bacterium]
MGWQGSFRPLLIGMALTLASFLSYEAGWLDGFELMTLDWRFRLRGAIAPHAPIVLVSIDQDSFDELNVPWPWPRTIHADLIRKLARSGARLIGFDILFPEPKADPREDRALSAAIREAGNVILAAELTDIPTAFGPRRTLSLAIPEVREHALASGPVNLTMDPDGIVRRVQPAFPFQGASYPSFAYLIYREWVRQTGSTPKEIPPAPLMINFRGPPRVYPAVSYYRILRDEIDASFFRGKIVLVGAFSPSLHDQFATPFSADRPTAGVEVQANVVETLLANDPITALPAWGRITAFLLLPLLAVAAAIRLKPLQALLVFLLGAGLYALATAYGFSEHQLWVPILPGLLAALISYGGITLDGYIREQKERLRLRATFAKYVSPDVLEEILTDRQGLGLAGKRRHVTMLFSDIRGFTTISERIHPEQVVSLLSDFLARATEIIFRHGGTIDKFIGDAVMAIFGAPRAHPDDALRAVRAGLDLLRLAESLSSEWARVTGNRLRVGVGINSGDAVVGSIGSEVRSDFTVIGDTVNLASRLEGLTKELGVPLLISESTANELEGSLPLKPLRQVKVTGREAPVLVFTVGDVQGYPEKARP